VWVALRNLPAGAAAVSIGRDLALMGFAAARAGELPAYRRGLVDAVRGTRTALATRRAIARPTRRRRRRIRALRPGLAARVIRHLREQLI
jgi:hypothetical protein